MTAARSQPSAAARPPVVSLLVVVAGADAFGDAAAMVTLMLRLYRAGNPAWAITALLFAMLGPPALLSPFAARVLVRWGVGRTLVTAFTLLAGAVKLTDLTPLAAELAGQLAEARLLLRVGDWATLLPSRLERWPLPCTAV